MKKFIYWGLFGIIILVSSCDKWLTIRPKDKIEKAKLYETEEGFWQALNGIYSLLEENYEVVNTSWQGYYADNLAGVWTTPVNSVGEKLEEHAYKDGNVDKKLGEVFLRFYKLIAHCNTILAYIDAADFLPERTYNLIKGEALAMRAFIHFDLIRIWGPMPTNVDEGYTYLPYVTQVSKQSMTYHTYSDYMRFLQEDLIAAEALLSASDPLLKYSCAELNTTSLMDEYERVEFYYRQHHMNYFGVCALRARVALWMGDKETAVTYAKIVKDAKNADGTSKFRLGTANDIDMSNNETNTRSLGVEHIVGFYMNYFNWDSYYGRTGNDQIYLAISKVNSLFSDGNDYRRANWIKETEDKQYMTITKYICYNDLWIPLIRYSEIYLILAEALPLEEANAVYKEFCEAKGCVYEALTEGNRQNRLLMEYYKDFLGEGQIFYANKRMAVGTMQWIKEDMAEGQYMLPLPSRESDLLN